MPPIQPVSSPPQGGPVLLDSARFRGDIDGKPVGLFTLRNQRGMVAGITSYGAKIEQLLVPDRNGLLDDVVLGYDSLDAVVNGSASMGAFVGRYAGRIENARFTLGGTGHVLTANNGSHCLHGGQKGSRFRAFDAVQRDDASVEMRYVFADGEEGFPGALALRLVYRVTEANELQLDYEALALDKPTVASFTTHAFFNLNGEASGSALGHEVMICADRYFEMTPDLIASGKLLPVAGTPFDFRQPA
ncbi:MAG: aldose epimerase family protein, partial [Polaromonas sp.]